MYPACGAIAPIMVLFPMDFGGSALPGPIGLSKQREISDLSRPASLS
jgi:hypothetical protein